MKLLVLAGGFGTRLRSVMADVPKALAPVGGEPFLQLQVEHWKNQGLRSFVFLLHHQAELIIDFLGSGQKGLLRDCEVRWLVEPEPMDTGGALAYAVERLHIRDGFLATNADTWLGTGIGEVSRAAAPAMAVVRVPDAGRYGSVQFDENNTVTAFNEKSPAAGAGWINAGLCRLDAGLFRDWDHRPFSLERAAFADWTVRGILKAVPLESDFIDIGIPDDYFRFCRLAESGKRGVM